MGQSIQYLMTRILEHDLETRNFSTLTIQISKRPITDQSGEFGDLMKYAVVADESQAMDGFPDITWKEFMDLTEDCRDFDNMRQLNQHASKFSPDEQREIISRFDDKYHDTKFWQLFMATED
jgi:hypothetical protein